MTATPSPSEVATLATAVEQGGSAGTRAAGRLMTLIENQPHRLAELIRLTGEDRMPRLLIGVTGAPGSGKSTLVDAMVQTCRRRCPDRRVGVVAVDPSSPFTGGAILGDRVRMMRHATDPDVYVRSLASRGRLGGLSLGVKGVVRVMGLLGCDVVFIETVGVGQSEVEVTHAADLVLVVLAPGQGDAVQLLKAGLLEIADLFIVNKADRDDAQALYQQLLATLELAPPDHGRGHFSAHALNPKDRVILVSATENTGVDALVDRIPTVADDARIAARRAASVEQDIKEAVLEAVRLQVIAAMDHTSDVAAVLDGRTDVNDLARDLLARAAGSSRDE